MLYIDFAKSVKENIFVAERIFQKQFETVRLSRTNNKTSMEN